MNILFYLDHSVATGFGGQERVTGCLATALVAKGIKCYYVHRMEYDNEACANRDVMFEGKRYIPDLEDLEFQLYSVATQWEIDVVVVQGVFDKITVWRNVVNKLNKSCRLIFAHHFNPGVEYSFVSKLHLINIFFQSGHSFQRRRWALKQLLTNNRLWKKTVRMLYRDVYEKVDNIVLLSKGFVDDWTKIAGVDDSKEKKIRVIPNMLSIESKEPVLLEKKEKIVLIVSRLEEKQKRISRALQIWRKIETDSSLKDWQLVIVGDGPNSKYYEEYAKKYLIRVRFEGYKEPDDYYRRASIFMMTSAFEGWGLTLTESQMMGSVPVCLNTFASASDIINNGENGFLVYNMKQYEKCLKLLMSDTTLRQRMALNAIESSKRFAPETVIEKWMDVFNLFINEVT